MVQRAVNNYYKFFDETLQSSTFIVLFISLLICAVGLFVPSVHAYSEYGKGNLIEIDNNIGNQNVVIISGVSYEISFTEIK